MKLTANAKDNTNMLSVKAIMVEFVIPYLMAIAGIPGAIMELERGDTKP